MLESLKGANILITGGAGMMHTHRAFGGAKWRPGNCA